MKLTNKGQMNLDRLLARLNSEYPAKFKSLNYSNYQDHVQIICYDSAIGFRGIFSIDIRNFYLFKNNCDDAHLTRYVLNICEELFLEEL